MYYGDLKPSNLLIYQTPSGLKVKVGDFGTSIDLNENNEGGLYNVRGATERYCSPEFLLN